ncbi:MAG: adenylyltransferase/cytidyltransferase family protein [Patescibacteria group bacterium]
MRQVYNKVLVFGVFDLLHPGHNYFLKQAKKYGKKLIVVVARDKTVKHHKQHYPVQNEQIRLRQIKSLPFVWRVMLGNKEIKHCYKMVKKIKPNVICLGYDQGGSIRKIKQDMKRHHLIIPLIRLKAYKPRFYKTSLIRHKLLPSR